jgi:hypothetical protein
MGKKRKTHCDLRASVVNLSFCLNRGYFYWRRRLSHHNYERMYLVVGASEDWQGIRMLMFFPEGRLFFASGPLNRKQKESNPLRPLWALATIGSGREI